jgi:hypothetical protein
MSATEAPRRLRAADVIDAQNELIERLTTRRDSVLPSAPSVELSRNAKGETQISVKASGESIEDAEKSATAAYDRLCAKYPAASGFARNEGQETPA